MRFWKISLNITASKVKGRYDKYSGITCATYAAAQRRDLVEPTGFGDPCGHFPMRRGFWSGYHARVYPFPLAGPSSASAGH